LLATSSTRHRRQASAIRAFRLAWLLSFATQFASSVSEVDCISRCLRKSRNRRDA
jgi:hypothetical protein